MNHRIYDFCIIGSGIIGASTAFNLKKLNPLLKIVILDQEKKPFLHQTGRNSGVIHSGIYYEPSSLKARLCRQGMEETKRFCKSKKIKFDECGKLIVATDRDELENLEKLALRAKENGLKIQRFSRSQINKIEPNVSGIDSIFIKETSIVDYKKVSNALLDEASEKGLEKRYDSKVDSIIENENFIEIKTKGGNSIRARKLIACAGLQADRIAKLSGLEFDFRVIPFRGDYFRLSEGRRNIIKRLIYPVPNPDMPFLGIHLTKMINGDLTVGPNAALSFAREKYSKFSFSSKDAFDSVFFLGFWKLLIKNRKFALDEFITSFNKGVYLKKCQKYCPSLEISDLENFPSGNRAQVVNSQGEAIHDFLFLETKRSLHVCNAPSPAATSSIPIGKMIAEKIYYR